MFGQSKPIPFEPYGRRRSRWHVPRWLVLLLSGIAIGAVGVIAVQERYLPPRLSADASANLRSALEQANAERVRLTSELGATTKRLEAALANEKGLTDQLDAGRVSAERLRDELVSVVASLPPDPRSGMVGVRAARFTAKDGTLGYDVVLTRERATGKPMAGVVQLVVTGESARGAESSAAPRSIPLSIGSLEIVRGTLPLPEGFRPRQVTIQVLDRAGGKALGMRVMLVK